MRIFGKFLLVMLAFQCVPVAHAGEGSGGVAAQCWQKKIKKDFPNHVKAAINYFLGKRRGSSAALDEVTDSEKIVVTHDYRIEKFDRDTGNITCNAIINVAFKTKNYGEIDVSGSTMEFQVVQSENGSEIGISIGNMESFLTDLKRQLSMSGIELDYTIVND